MKNLSKLAIAACLGSCLLLLAGCKEETEMTKKEQENFKGGPPPAGFFDQQGNQPKPGN